MIGPIRPPGAPGEEARLAVCPHCWNVTRSGGRLCVRCGADMTTLLQESGGLRRTAPVQSPMPIRAAGRLSGLQRLLIGVIVILLALSHLLGALAPGNPRPRPEPAVPAGF